MYEAEKIAGNDVNCEIENQEMADVDEYYDVGPVGNSSISTEQKKSEIAGNDASCVVKNQEMSDGDESHDVEKLSPDDSAGNNNQLNNDNEIQSGDRNDGPVGNLSILTEQNKPEIGRTMQVVWSKIKIWVTVTNTTMLSISSSETALMIRPVITIHRTTTTKSKFRAEIVTTDRSEIREFQRNKIFHLRVMLSTQWNCIKQWKTPHKTLECSHRLSTH